MILYLGRLHPGKGLELLIPAFASIAGEVPRAVLVIAGPDSGGFRARVEQMVRDGGITDRVVFTGLLQGDDRAAALNEADLLALPSYHENFGMVVGEALAAGTPVLVSNQVNLHADVAAAGVGVVVPTEVPAVANALRRWLLDDTLRRAAAERAAPFARDRFNWTQIGQRWVNHYARILSSARLTEHARASASGSTRTTTS
jgi:glycosyltransferase involved in cell wall biosynthesis